MTVEEMAAALLAGRADVLAALAAAGRDVTRRPPDGGWSAWEIAYHLFDIERWYLAKLCEAASPDRPAALARFVQAWSELREASVALAGRIPAEQLDRPGLLSGVPEWTPRGLLEIIASHDHEHAAQIRASIEGPPVRADA
jgi:hypothetical protein